MKCKKLKKGIAQAVCLALGTCLLSGCASESAGSNETSHVQSETTEAAVGNKTAEEEKNHETSEIQKGVYKNAVCCHDPQIILAEDGKYYMTGSHQVLAKSDDLSNWSYIGNGNNVFDNLFSGNLDAFKYVGKNEEGSYSVWAGNTIYNEAMGKYVMYFCTTSSYIKSNICMAVSDTPEGKFTYTDTILYSGFSKTQADQTNIYEVLGEDADISRYLKLGGYDNTKWPNCIDPAVFTDSEGKMWMVYGSWSGGIFLLELDPDTGKPIYPVEAENSENGPDPYFGYRLVGGGHHAVEGPYITYSPETGYYYLFLSYGSLTSNGGYQIRQFRSENPTGPYVDAAGNTLGDEENYMSYGVKMMGNYTLPSLSVTYMAPGGQSTFQDEEGNYYITYHQRFDDGQEFHEPRVHRMFLTEDGWFTASVFEYTDDSAVSAAEDGTVSDDSGELNAVLEGTWNIVNHGLDVNDLVNESSEYTFESGEITANSGEAKYGEGTYSVNAGTSNITITMDGVRYSGILIMQTDEAGNKTLCISAVGENNETIWAVKYI